MAVTIKRLRRLQVGQEVTEGTEVAATAVLLPENFSMRREPEVYEPQQDIGLLPQRHPGILTQKRFNWNFDGDLTYEQAIYLFANALVDVNAGAGAGADKTWTFTPSPTGANSVQPLTMEARYSDGTNNIDETYPGCITQELEISASLAESTKFRASGFARSQNGNAITAALSAPATLTIPAGQDWGLRSDANWAALGTTPVLGTLHGFTWTFTTGFNPAWYLDNSLSPTRSRRTSRMARLQLQLDQEAVSGLVGTARTKLDDRTGLYIQLRAVGPTLGATTYMIRLDGFYTVSSISEPEDHEGDDSFTVELMSKYDVTGAQDVRAVVINADAAMA